VQVWLVLAVSEWRFVYLSTRTAARFLKLFFKPVHLFSYMSVRCARHGSHGRLCGRLCLCWYCYEKSFGSDKYVLIYCTAATVVFIGLC